MEPGSCEGSKLLPDFCPFGLQQIRVRRSLDSFLPFRAKQEVVYDQLTMATPETISSQRVIVEDAGVAADSI